ncbi:S-adenosylmethionine decarboxylase proenzyme [Acidovorax sp. HDW3]|uniref:S-adenosylmethionine decarboxylase family protein n=1 Tax=Acidovorax sp. HDW3 TaxID=2714923 RepID=UPI00140E6B20|nr:S-adenosylmethionine decarboxylase [Acidovorax sp. HDW3]QIL44867.1 S-adenosylmethionine decarboxylase proenzyme [Acidovorax sp. HDW3]
MQGLHLTADLYGCAGEAALLLDAARIAALCRQEVLACGLTPVGERWVTFPPYQGRPSGVTGTVLLAESHLALHTWPESASVTLDVYVCNFSGDNSDRARTLLARLIAAYAPAQQQCQELRRGGPVLT